jgi:hypothetical protein
MISTPSTNVLMAEQWIAALEQEIFSLRSTKKNFDGVEITRPPPHTNKPAHPDPPKTTEPSAKPKPTEQLTSTSPTPSKLSQPPVHPFSNIGETSYQPPHEHERNLAATPAKAKEPAYQMIAPIQNPKITNDVYNKSMKALLITLSPEELFAISPEVRNQLREVNECRMKRYRPMPILNKHQKKKLLLWYRMSMKLISITLHLEKGQYLSMLLKNHTLFDESKC